MLPRFLYPGTNNVGRQDHSINFQRSIRIFDGLDWNSPLSWAGAYRFLKNEKPDVIIMQWWSSSVAHLELFLALANHWKVKSRLIIEMHEILDPLEARNLPIRLYSRITGKLIMRNADAFIAHSAPLKSQALKIYHLRDDQVFIIPHGVYDSYFQAQDKANAKKALGIGEEFVVLYFGMLRRYKGIPGLIEAFNRLPEPIALNSRLIIAGEDWGDEKGLDTLIQSSSYSRQITFKPEFIPESAVPDYFTAADVVALPYLRTSGSGVAGLAIAYGKPVIVSDLECTRDSLQEYKGAIFVPAGDTSSLAARIIDLHVLQKSGQSLSWGVPLSLTWPHIVRQYEEIISKLKLQK